MEKQFAMLCCIPQSRSEGKDFLSCFGVVAFPTNEEAQKFLDSHDKNDGKTYVDTGEIIVTKRIFNW